MLNCSQSCGKYFCPPLFTELEHWSVIFWIYIQEPYVVVCPRWTLALNKSSIVKSLWTWKKSLDFIGSILGLVSILVSSSCLTEDVFVRTSSLDWPATSLDSLSDNMLEESMSNISNIRITDLFSKVMKANWEMHWCQCLFIIF